METCHRLKILDDRDFYALPLRMQFRHLSHVRNDLQGAYVSDMRPLPDLDENGRRVKKSIDTQELMASIARQHHAPPSQQVIDNARLMLSLDGVPDIIKRDARQTLERAGVSP